MARKKMKSLTDRHLAAIRLKIEGRTCREIAEALEVELRTVYLWFSDPIVKDELGRQREHIFDVFAERMADVGLRAIRLLEETAELKLTTDELSVEQRLDVVREILDRIPLLSKRYPSNGKPEELPPGMTDDELLTRLKRVLPELPEGEVLEGEVVA